MPFKIVLNDITKVNADAIVNAANESLSKGSGVCGAIFSVTNDERLLAECLAIGHCKTGHAIATKSYGLNSKYIIHAVGPVYDENDIGLSEKLLRSAYSNSLNLGKRLHANSIAFPLISAGKCGYPKQQALEIAVQEITAFLENNEMDISLVIHNKTDFVTDQNHIKKVADYIDQMLLEHQERNIKYSLSEAQQHGMAMPYIEKIKYEDRVSFKKEKSVYSKYSKSFNDIFNNMDETFSQKLLLLIKQKDKNEVEVYKKANIDRRLFSKIKNNKDYSATKQTVLAFAIALELSMEETRDLLLSAGYALSKSNTFDIIITYHIIKKRYSIFDINEVLFEFNQPLLGV